MREQVGDLSGHNRTADAAVQARLVDAELLERIREEHERRAAVSAAAGRFSGVDADDQPIPSLEPCPEYQLLAARLVGYAVPVLKDLLRTGRIRAVCAERDIAVGLSEDDFERLHTSLAARDALAVSVVIAAEEYFRRVVIPKRKWSPDGGAKLETYFVTGCLFQLAGTARAWRREHADWHLIDNYMTTDGELIEGTASRAVPDVADLVGDKDQLRRVLSAAPAVVRAIAKMIMDEDLTFAEIGERLGYSERSVEGRLYRFRSQLRAAAKRKRVTTLAAAVHPAAAEGLPA